MPNAPHILETALLLLAAFLIGCVIGYLLRRLATARSRPAAGQPVLAVPPAATAEALVVAPKIEPITAPAPRPLRASAMAAAKPVAEIATAADAQTVQPAHVAGETSSGKIIATPAELPVAPQVEPEPAEIEVIAAEVPPIDEAAHVVEAQAAAATVEPQITPGSIEISWSELSGRPVKPEALGDQEAEDAAMRAIEGSWTPRPAPRATPRRVELPEPIEGAEPAPAEAGIAEPADLSPAEIEGALSAARSAVAAASAAAEAAIAEYLPPQDSAEPAAIDEVAPPTGNHAPFGRPPGLDAPRDGRKDDLRQIKGVTPQIEAALNGLGIFHFDQIADWDKKATVWIDNNLALKGRLGREKWIEQARDLARLPVHARRTIRR